MISENYFVGVKTMNILDLADLLLSPDEKKELQTSMELLEKSSYSAFYESNQNIIKSILF